MSTLLKSQDPEATGARRWKMPWAAAAIGLFFLAGAGLVLYPPTASWFSQYNQSRVIESTGEVVDQGPSARLQEELGRASEYNDALSGGALLSPGANVPTSESATDGIFAYEDLLRATNEGVMGRLRIPSINVELPIYHGTSDAVLEKGVGHLEGTSLPVGGESEHSVLTAHRGLPSANMFNDLNKVQVGETFTVELFGEVLTYQATETHTVLPDETQTLLPRQDEDLLTLVTCTPLGINTHRYLVTGTRITPTPIADLDNAGTAPEIPGFPWWALGVGGVLAGYGVFVWRSGRVR